MLCAILKFKIGTDGCPAARHREAMKTAVKAGAPPRDYADLHDLIRALDDAGLLVTVDIPINKDTELHPLVRWQFRGGMPADERKAWLFTNVTDAKGKKYDMPVLIGFLGSSPRVYSTGLDCSIEDSIDTWARALGHPIPPQLQVEATSALALPYAAMGRPGCHWLG